MFSSHPVRIVQISVNTFPAPGLIYTEPRRDSDNYYGSVLKRSPDDFVPVLVQERAISGLPSSVFRPAPASSPAQAVEPVTPPPAAPAAAPPTAKVQRIDATPLRKRSAKRKL